MRGESEGGSPSSSMANLAFQDKSQCVDEGVGDVTASTDFIGSYNAHLMDEETIQSLRRALRQSEADIERFGHVREFSAPQVKVDRVDLRPPSASRSHESTRKQSSGISCPPIRRRDTFTTAVVKHHLGIDVSNAVDDDVCVTGAGSRDMLALARPTSANVAKSARPPPRPRPATVFVGKQQTQRRSFQVVQKEEKVAYQALEAQYTVLRDVLIRHMDRLCLHGRPQEAEASASVYTKLAKFDEKLKIQHPEYTQRKPRRSLRPVTSHRALPPGSIKARAIAPPTNGFSRGHSRVYNGAMDPAAAAVSPRCIGRVITANLLIDRVGLYEIVGAKELILRDDNIEGLDEACAKDLASLELLSLSHNKLCSLEHFDHLTNLIELNVNFNQIDSLDALQCFGLQKLYAANNKLTSVAPLRAFTKLTHVSVFGNDLPDLDAVLHTCRHVLKLRSLDLDGNPCARVKGYKYSVLRLLPRLKELDGDVIHQLDRELLLSEPPAPTTRPSTAPPAAPTTTQNLRAKGSTSWAPSDDLRGPVQLFRDDFLNNNPILLEYLAQGVHDPPEADPEDVASPPSLSSSSSFVGKMRFANPDTSDNTAPSSSSSSSSPLKTPRCPMATPAPLSTHAIVDPSDPKTTIRKLLKHIEHLTTSADMYKAQASDAAVATLMEENARLRIENNNIPILQEEIQSLKAQVRHQPSAAAIPPLASLQAENAALKREVQKLRDMLAARPDHLCKEEILDDAASVDVELTALMMQNEISLKLMRHTIQKTKLEMQQERAAHLTGTQRPSTSGGELRVRSSPEEPPPPRAVRRLHTSAGRRAGSMPLAKKGGSSSKSTKVSKTTVSHSKMPSVREAIDEDNNRAEASGGPSTADVLVL
ncbi:Aste57867_4964 [Aphanomyces stellatus]|uniref:Aste57867_4964 protein n=1 Tax=Aphanomyces stellatus TaxID=120398 RepID=A0A485KDP4_9STRA|nr:hypothetical protein As57867_004951 [Aphanomyces stellatus]VFT82052.1 Aste57867_4964 [Aphanomyces stellatus]